MPRNFLHRLLPYILCNRLRSRIPRPTAMGSIAVISPIISKSMRPQPRRPALAPNLVYSIHHKMIHAPAAFILPLDHETSLAYGRLKSGLRKPGRVLMDNDLWIAAVAVRHSVPLISNNLAHFGRVPGLVLISEAPKRWGTENSARKL